MSWLPKLKRDETRQKLSRRNSSDRFFEEPQGGSWCDDLERLEPEPDPSGPSKPIIPLKGEGRRAAAKAEARPWIDDVLERRRIETRLGQVQAMMARHNAELEGLAAEAEAELARSKLPMGTKASDMLLKAELRAKEMGHRAVGTGDVLWAMFHHSESKEEESTAIKFLKKRGVTKESVFASHRYSDNAGRIVALAAQRSSELNKSVVGTEDLLWAIFQIDDHTHSRSQAIQRLERRGVNMDLVWNVAELSETSQKALKKAVANCKERGHRVIGSEDMVEALFSVAGRDSGARHWMTTQHIPGLPPSAFTHESDDPATQIEESIPRMFVVGGIAGTVETFLVQPLVFWKTMSQVSPERLFTAANLKPANMYRGVLVNAASISPISALQYGANGLLTAAWHAANPGGGGGGGHGSAGWTHGDDKPAAATTTATTAAKSAMSPSTSLGIAGLTGALSACVVAPAEMVMITQQRSGASIAGACHEVWKACGMGGFQRGFIPTCAREAGWTFGFLGLAPVVKSALREDSKFFLSNEVAASLAASTIAGLAAATLTQPADTVKTLMQADLASPRKFGSTWDAARHLYHAPGGGISAFWRGIVPRAARCTVATFILGECQTRLSNVFDHYGVLLPTENADPQAAAAASRPRPAANPSPLNDQAHPNEPSNAQIHAAGALPLSAAAAARAAGETDLPSSSPPAEDLNRQRSPLELQRQAASFAIKAAPAMSPSDELSATSPKHADAPERGERRDAPPSPPPR